MGKQLQPEADQVWAIEMHGIEPIADSEHLLERVVRET